MKNKREEKSNSFATSIVANFDSLLYTIPHPVFFKNLEYKYVRVNKACADVFGKSISEIEGGDDFDLFPKSLAEKMRRADQTLLDKKEERITSEILFLDVDGQERWFRTTKTLVEDEAGTLVGITGFALDITDSKIANAELELLEPAINQTTDAIVITDTDGVIKFVNPAFEALTGYANSEVIGEKTSILKSGRQSDEYYETLWKTIIKGDTWTGRFINKRKDNKTYEEDATISPVFDKKGNITHFIGVKKDVTKLVELENKKRQSQKREAVGRWAGGVAHDFNNILTAILGYSEILLGILPEGDPSYGKVEEIKKAGLRASEITRQMLVFSKKQVMRLKPLNINNIIKGMLEMLKGIAGPEITFNLKLARRLNAVNSEKIHIERIVMNLVVNAVDALGPDGGEIVISSGSKFISKPFSDGNFSAQEGKYVCISVSDKGCGMSDDVLEHVFEPFFTKKQGERGTGLGLSTVYGIVKQHEGFINVDSAPDEGSQFDIFFPALTSAESLSVLDTHSRDVVDYVEGAPATLLLVDDEVALLEMMYESLTASGFHVLKATSALEALELFFMAGEEIDLLVSDIILHGMSGIDLTSEIRKTAPGIPVVFISGYTGNEYDVLSFDADLIDFLPKPFVMEELEERIAFMLQKRM
jgi:PAS domain S-box-containing protein